MPTKSFKPYPGQLPIPDVRLSLVGPAWVLPDEVPALGPVDGLFLLELLSQLHTAVTLDLLALLYQPLVL